MLPAYCTQRPGKALQHLREFNICFSRSQLRFVALQRIHWAQMEFIEHAMRGKDSPLVLACASCSRKCCSWLFPECRLTGLEWPLPGCMSLHQAPSTVSLCLQAASQSCTTCTFKSNHGDVFDSGNTGFLPVTQASTTNLGCGHLKTARAASFHGGPIPRSCWRCQKQRPPLGSAPDVLQRPFGNKSEKRDIFR